MLAPGLEVTVGVEAGAGGREQHDLARGGVGRRRAARPRRARRTGGARPRRSTPGEIAFQPLRGLADQVRRHAALAHRLGQLAEPATLERAAEDRPDPAVERAQRRARRGDVGRLRVVDVEHTVELADALEPMRDPGEGAKTVGDCVAVDAERPGGGGGGGGVLGIVRSEQGELAGFDQRLAPELEHRPERVAWQSSESAGWRQKAIRLAQPPRSRSRSAGSEAL